MTSDDQCNLPIRVRIKSCQAQIRTWDKRAAMASQQGNDNLVDRALEKKRAFENELARLQEYEVDEG